MKKQIVESCEMCSRETRSPTTIKVEGALLNVCGNCVSFGNVIEDKKTQLNYVKSQKTQNKNVEKGVSRTGGFKRKMSIKNDEKDKEYLIENYGRVINQARMKKSMTQEQLSFSRPRPSRTKYIDTAKHFTKAKEKKEHESRHSSLLQTDSPQKRQIN